VRATRAAAAAAAAAATAAAAITVVVRGRGGHRRGLREGVTAVGAGGVGDAMTASPRWTWGEIPRQYSEAAKAAKAP